MSRRPSFTIPERDRAAGAYLFRLGESEQAAILSAFQEVDPVFQAHNLIKQLTERIDEGREQLPGVVRIVLNLYRIWDESGAELDFLLDGFAKTIEKDSDLSLEESEISRTLELLTQIFKLNSVAVSAKGVRVMTSNAETYLSSEVISDIRSIFGVGQEVGKPEAAVVVHNLHIHHVRGGRYNDFYVSMDIHDMVSLKSSLERAIEKHTQLGKVIESANLIHLIPDDE